MIERILGVSLSVQALEANVAEAAGEVSAFYDQPAEPLAPALDATILVVQADGKGVPMVPPSPAVPPVRLGKGQKRGKKKEAVVTGLYRTSGRIQPETYGFVLQENCPLVHEPDFDFLNGFSDRFSTQNSP